MTSICRYLLVILFSISLLQAQTTKPVKQLKQKQHHVHLVKSVLKAGYKTIRFLTF